MRYLLTVAYDGSKFNGFQKQPDKNTVQDKLEEALTKLYKKEINVTGSGRTDALVHAYSQKVHFDAPFEIPINNIQTALNDILYPSIRIRMVEEVTNTFHARYDVVNKTYLYKINLREYNPLEVNYAYQYCRSLSIDKINEAAKYLVGTHDYQAFTSKKDIKEDYIRTIYKIDVTTVNNYLIIELTGTGFMRYMVRNIIGTLILVGEGKIEPIKAKEILESKDRDNAGPTAPAEGLYLVNVNY
jgi:tRNA pseudouridine38-40 synthase